MVKKAGGKTYFYYGLIPLLRKDTRYKEIVTIYDKALAILASTRFKVFDIHISGNMIPFNIVAVDTKRSTVSLLWYTGFWESEKPLLVYSVKVDVEKGDVKVFMNRNFNRGSWPWNYLHRKELFIDGLERIAIDPYGNGLTLMWDNTNREDKWTMLPWYPVNIGIRLSDKDNYDKIIDAVKNIITQIISRRSHAKILLTIEP